jgi:hypothetical protein
MPIKIVSPGALTIFTNYFARIRDLSTNQLEVYNKLAEVKTVTNTPTGVQKLNDITKKLDTMQNTLNEILLISNQLNVQSQNRNNETLDLILEILYASTK